jgi:hypothetical protein
MPQDVPLHHRRLIAWQRADDLFIKIHGTSLTFPAHERYELGSQLRRAAYSVVPTSLKVLADGHAGTGCISCTSRRRLWPKRAIAFTLLAGWDTSPLMLKRNWKSRSEKQRRR